MCLTEFVFSLFGRIDIAHGCGARARKLKTARRRLAAFRNFLARPSFLKVEFRACGRGSKCIVPVQTARAGLLPLVVVRLQMYCGKRAGLVPLLGVRLQMHMCCVNRAVNVLVPLFVVRFGTRHSRSRIPRRPAIL